MCASDRDRPAPGRLTELILGTGLTEPGSSGILLLSGGPDSIALLAGLAATELADLAALHLNYGLRADSGADQKACELACGELGVELVVDEPGPPRGNLQDWARRRRYESAEALRRERGAGWIAVAHTLDDVAETVIYRLASSPGRRSLAAMQPASGFVVRPLIGLTRAQTRALAVDSGLGFVDDPSNEDPAFARVRIRREVLPVLEEINPAAAANVVRTRTELLEEGDYLDRLAAEVLDRSFRDGRLPVGALAESHPALRRLVIRALVEREIGEPLPFSIDQAAAAWRLATDPEGGLVDLGGGRRLRMEAGSISVEGGSPDVDRSAAELAIDSAAAWGGWALGATTLDPPFEPAGPDVATLDRARLAPVLTVRAWQPGDRIRALGMEGTKTLQDLFTDAGVPRSERQRIPVFLSGSEIVWVTGLAIAHRHRLGPDTSDAVRLSAVRAEPD